MEYEEEHGFPGSVPKFGAIFMSNVATKKECFRRKLLGLPSAQANFVKQVKAGMVLFLFEFERRELYGVFQACSDGAMNIVPHAFSSSGKQFPAQVHFTPIWYCRPLSEHEFQDAIIENYFSNKKFNCGLSEDQVRRLLWLFNSRKLENKLPQRQFSRAASKPIGEDRRVAGSDSFFLRNREEKYVEEDGLFLAISKKYPGNSSSDVRRLDDDRFLKSDGIENKFNLNNCCGYDIVTEHPGASLGKRRRRDNDGRFSMQDTMEYNPDVDHGLGQVICTDPPGDSLYESGRVVEDRQFLRSDRVESKCIMDSNIGPVVTPEYPGDSLDKVRRPTDDGRFPIRNIVGDKHISANVFGLVKSTDHLENPAFEPRRATDDHRFFKDCRAENFCNLDNDPKCIISADHHVDRLGKVRRTTDDSNFFVNDRIEIDCHVDNGIKPILSAEYLENPVSKLKKATNDGQLLMNDRLEIPIEHFVDRLDYVRRANNHDRFFANISLENEHNVDNGLGPVNSTVHPGYPLDKIRRVADEGMFLKSDGVDNAYNMENCFVPPLSTGYTDLSESGQSPSSYSSKAILERDYSLGQEHHRPCSALPRSMEQKNSEFPYPASHDAIVARAVPYYAGVPGIHHRRSSSVGVDCTSHSIQDFPPHHNSGGNIFASTMKQSSPYRLEAKDLSHYRCSCCQTSNSLLSAGYSGKMEAQATGHEGYEDPLFSESASATIPFSRSEISERQNMYPFIEYDKHVAASQGRYKHKIPQHETNQAFSDEDAPFSNNVSHLHSGSSHEKSNNHDIKYYRYSEGMRSDSKRDRNSVFSRLTFASDVCIQENGTDMGDDECDMDVSVDQVMDTLHQSLNHRIMKVRKFPLVRQHDMEERRRIKKRDMIYNQIECDKLTMMNLKMENDVKRGIDENCGQIVEETRVVGFKRRSETKKIQDGTKTKSSVEIVEHQTKGSFREPKDEGLDKQHKRRKLVRPVFGKKGQSNEGLSRDGSSDLQLLSHESFSEDNTYQTKESSSKDNAVSCDDEVKSLENENRGSPNAGFVQLTRPAGCEDNNTYVEQSSDCRKKNSENCELVRQVFSGKDSFCLGISSNCTSNLQLLSHEGSNAKENTGSCDELVRSRENDDMSSQNVGFMHVTNSTICEAGNINPESSDCRQRNAVNGGATLKCEEHKDGKRTVPEDGMGDQPT